MKTVETFNFNNHRAIIRVDFNVPLNAEFKITDDSRMKAALPTINKILNDGGSVILMSHLGRPKEGPAEKYSLKHLVNHLSELLNGKSIQFANDCMGDEAIQKSAALKSGEVLLLENLRFYKEEEKGNDDFAKKLASYADVYVNDAFGTAHRAHASTTIIANHFADNKKMFGYLMAAEVANGRKVALHPEKPFTAIIGGAKVSDKILIIEKLLDTVDALIIGGGMTYTFMKAQGKPIGKSLCEDDRVETAKQLIEKAKAKNVKLLLPLDSVIADKFAVDAATSIVDNDNILADWMGLDIGPKTIELFSNQIKHSKTILWNGPMGVFEMKAFENGTKKIAEAIVEATTNGAFSLIGGGDSAAAINQFNLASGVSYVSTGGGALLEFFEGKELPGVAAIEKKSVMEN
jgi:phosphoglycerate kinase